jgi:putative intracellular protease/amidase
LGNTGKQTGFYLPEVAHPYHIFVSNNYEVVFASPKGGESPCDEGSIKSYKNDKICVDFWNDLEIKKLLKNTHQSSDLSYKDYKAIYFAGGHGLNYFKIRTNVGYS